MRDLSKYFDREEFNCKCKRHDCEMNTVDHELIKVLEKLHEDIAYIYKARIRILINSGNRCGSWNTVIGGVPESYHLISKAADIIIEAFAGGKWRKIETKVIHDCLCKEYSDKYGFIWYDNFNHVDVREQAYRSDRTNKMKNK